MCISVPGLLILNSFCCWWREWGSAGVLLDWPILDICIHLRGKTLPIPVYFSYGNNLEYPQRCGYSKYDASSHWPYTSSELGQKLWIPQTGQVKARQVEIWTQKVLAIGALSSGLFVWWISARVVTSNLLNEKLVQDFGFDLFHLCQEDKKSPQKINLNLWTDFLFTELGSPADFCLIAEILGIPFQELWRYAFPIILPTLPDSLPPITLSIFSAPHSHPLLSVSLSCFFIFSLCSCLVSFAHFCLCFVSLMAKACSLQGLSEVWICL